MNRANARVHLDISDVERALGVTARVPHPVRHRNPAVRQPRRAGRARQAACAGRARARARSPTGTQPRTPGPADRRTRGASRAASTRLAPVANRRSQSCLSSTHAGRTCSSSRARTRTVAARRAAPARAPVRHRPGRPDALRRQRRARTSCAASCRSRCTRRSSEEHIALSAAERAQLIQDVTDDTLGYGPIDRFLHDPGITEVMVQRPEDGLHRAPRQDRAHRRRVRRRGPPAPHDRQDREPGRPAHRRGVADGRRPPARRFPCERGRSTRSRSADRSSRSGGSRRTRTRSTTSSTSAR